MAELDAAASWHAADKSCKVLAHNVALAETPFAAPWRI